MKKMIHFLILFFLVISCQKKQEIIKTNLLENSNWLLGNWENKTKEAYSKETWTKKNDSLYFANSFITVGRDTVFHETVDLLQKKDSLFFNVTSKGQNQGEMVSFYCTKNTINELVFENPKHDFPTKIVYKLITKDSIVASIHGINKGKKVDEIFPMKRK